MGLLNPVVRTMRGLCEASPLKRVQEDKPLRATVRRGKDGGRAVWLEHWEPGDA